jgi:hypothetical protein
VGRVSVAADWRFVPHALAAFDWLVHDGFVALVVNERAVRFDRESVRVSVTFEEPERGVDVRVGRETGGTRRDYTLSEVAAGREGVTVAWQARDEGALARGLRELSESVRLYARGLLTGDDAAYAAAAAERTRYNAGLQARAARAAARRARDEGRLADALALYESLGAGASAADRRQIAELRKLV